MWTASLCLLGLCVLGAVYAAPGAADVVNEENGNTQKRALAKKPNILYFLADDLGWNDVSWHNDEVVAPVMKAMVADGIELDNAYVQNVCTPSRYALMTGMYPYHSGMQHGMILASAPECAPLTQEFLPEALKKLGYGTHMLGKWHLGMCDWKCTPTYRGFDSFYGFYQGFIDHYTHMFGNGHDWRDGEEVVHSNDGVFASDLLTDRAIEIMNKQDPEEPFFMYFSSNNVHIPLQVPDQYYALYADRTDIDENRKKYLGMVSSMDHSMERLVQGLKDNGLYDNTIIVFSADNGGESPSGNNAPLRGAKGSNFDGGIRAASFVHSPLFSKTKGKKLDQMIHVTDWFPTLLSMAGGDSKPALDGVDQSDALINDGASKRDTMILNIDDIFPQAFGHAAIRKGDWKLISGIPGLSDGRNGSHSRPWNMEEYAEFQARRKRAYTMTQEEIMAMNTVITNMEGNSMLFNMKDDPYEYKDLATSNPDKVAELQALLDEAAKEIVTPHLEDLRPVAEANPDLNGGEWEPGWCTK